MSRPRAKAPRIFIYTGPDGALRLHGSRGGPGPLAHGAQVDFDEVIGDGPSGPETIEQQLGGYAETFFRPASPAPLPPVAQDEE